MNMVTSMILRRMRTPFLVLITVYTVAIIGMILIPGLDDQGKPWHMSLFHAIYFVSFTATTIGFGEIPYPLSDGQRLWVIATIYFTVTAWFYALGKILSLIQDKTFRNAVERTQFKRNVQAISQPFYLVCGFGETGTAVVNLLSEEHFRSVVVEKNPANISVLKLNELSEFVPGINGDATLPETLELAGIRHPMCRGVVAVTSSDETNLKIAIISKLLHPDIRVACRSEYRKHEDNMLSFGTDYIINPHDAFAQIFAMAMHSSSLHLINDWLTGAPETKLSSPVCMTNGHWILCGYGRFGKKIFKVLQYYELPATIIDPDPALKDEFDRDYVDDNYNLIVGDGTDAKTLTRAGVADSVGLIAGSNNDPNNLSIIMTARAINHDLFIVARENRYFNNQLYAATNSNITMRQSDITARKIRMLYLTPLLEDYLNLAREQDVEWANITISRLTAILGESRPYIWSIMINSNNAPAIATALQYGRIITIGNITQDPAVRNMKLKCVPLLIVRGNDQIIMPDDVTEIKAFDHILFCGTRDMCNSMQLTLTTMSSLNYVMTQKKEPESYVWRMLYRKLNKIERRTRTRT